MSAFQSLGASLPVLLMFFGVLVFSVATAVVAVLADS
jgi:hypothetical protein